MKQRPDSVAAFPFPNSSMFRLDKYCIKRQSEILVHTFDLSVCGGQGDDMVCDVVEGNSRRSHLPLMSRLSCQYGTLVGK